MQRKRVWTYWLFGALLTAAMFISLKFLTNFRFENSDDIVMVKSFMGFEGGQPADFSLYLHTLLAWALYAVSLCVPNMAWFSYFQIALLFISCMVIVKGMYQLARDIRRPVLSGTLAGAVFLAAFAVFASCRINFTTTAAMAGAAAVVQMTTVDFETAEKGIRVRALLLALVMLATGYCLRAYAVLPSLLFLGAVLLWRLIPQVKDRNQDPVPWRAILKAALIFAAVFIALFGIRQAEISLRGLRGYMDWNDANGALLDYTNFEMNAAPAVASGSGLSESEIKLVQQWYFMSSDIDEQALWKMADAYETERNGWIALRNFFAGNARYQYLAAALVLLCGLSLLSLRRRAWSAPLLSLGSLAAAFVLLVYLAARGRLLSRAVDSVLIPCMALNLGFALYSWKDQSKRGARLIAAILLSAMVAVAAFGSLRLAGNAIASAPDVNSPQREADLEAYALQNPDLLIVRTPNLLRDTRLFPDVSDGTPGNILLWGDWQCRTPNWNRQLALFGFDADHFTSEDWLKDNIVFAALSQEETADLSAYLTEDTGKPVVAEESGAYGRLRFYRFVNP